MNQYGNEAPGAPSLQAELAKVREENVALKSLRQENEALCRVSEPQFCCWLQNFYLYQEQLRPLVLHI